MIDELPTRLSAFAKAYSVSCATHPAEADDFYQEIMQVFLVVGRSLENKLTGGDLEKFAKTCARNRIRNLVKNKNVRVKYSCDLEEAEFVGDWKEEKERLLKNLVGFILLCTEGRDREFLEMFLQGYTIHEIVKHHSCTVRTWFRVMEKIRKIVVATEWYEG